MKGKLKSWDIVIFAMVFLVAAILFLSFNFAPDGGERLIVSHPSGEESYSLSKDKEFSISSNGYTLHIVIEKGSARVEESDCPDKTCIHSGAVEKRGQTVVCLPAGVTLRVVGEEDGYDFVAG